MDPSDVVSHPNSGVHIHGLFLEGASWEEGKGDDEGYISDSKMKDSRELWMDLYMFPSELCGFMWYLSDFSCDSCHHLLGASSRDASGEHLLSPYWRNESCLWRNCLYFTGPIWSETCTIMGFEKKWAGANVGSSKGDWTPWLSCIGDTKAAVHTCYDRMRAHPSIIYYTSALSAWHFVSSVEQHNSQAPTLSHVWWLKHIYLLP